MRAQITLLVSLAALVACKGKRDDAQESAPEPAAVRPAQVAGLTAIPSDAAVVVGFNVHKLRDAALVQRGLRAVFDNDPGLGRRVTALLSDCGIDPRTDLATLLIATGATPDQALLVATGAMDEARLPACVETATAAAGGAVSRVTWDDGRVAWASEPRAGRTVWFAFGAPRTVVASTSEAWLRQALARGAKGIRSNADMQAILNRVDRQAGMWAAGRVDPQLGGGLARVTGGEVKSPPLFMFAHLYVDKGLRAELAAVMASEDDAATLVRFARAQLQTYEIIAQGAGLGRLVASLRVDARDDTVFLKLELSEGELDDAVSRIDKALSAE
jgi:hypothetical protein